MADFDVDVRNHPLYRLHHLVSYLWWVPPFFACLPNWIPYLALVFLLDRIRKTGFADPYKSRFQVYWYVSLVACIFGIRARTITVETPIQRLVDLFILVGVSFAAYYFIEDVTEIFRREQISRKVWSGVRKIALVVLSLQVFLSFAFAFHQLSDGRTAIKGVVGILIVMYVVAWAVLIVTLHTATSAVGPFLENRLQYGTIVPIESPARSSEFSHPFQFNLMTMFLLVLAGACAIEYWNQPPRLDRIVVKKSAIDRYALTMRVADAAYTPKLIVIEQERSRSAFPDSVATQLLLRYPRQRYLMIDATKVWAKKVPRLYLYNRDRGSFRRLKLTKEALEDAANRSTSAKAFWVQHVAPQLEQKH